MKTFVDYDFKRSFQTCEEFGTRRSREASSCLASPDPMKARLDLAAANCCIPRTELIRSAEVQTVKRAVVSDVNELSASFQKSSPGKFMVETTISVLLFSFTLFF